MSLTPNAYSFLNFEGTVNDQAGGGSCNIGAGAGIAPEGVSFAYDDAKVTKTIGADGTPMFSLHATKGGKATVRFLKTSPNNAIMNEIFRFGIASSANIGQILITGGDPTRGDSVTAQQCAIMKQTDLVYNVEGPAMEWTLEVGILDIILGTGLPG